MKIKDGQNIIFEISEDIQGKCEIKVLDYFYFKMFYPQGDRLNELNRELVNIIFSERNKIANMIVKDNTESFNWQVS